MNLSPTSSSLSISSSSSSSTASDSTLHPGYGGLSPILRRRSVDTGGLHLAVNDRDGSGSGRGYGGWADNHHTLPDSIFFAELVAAMREQTHNIIDQAHPVTSDFAIIRPGSETDTQREIYIRKLSSWHFDASHLPPDEVLLCTVLLFELLWCIDGMEKDLNVPFDSLPPFLERVSKIYRQETYYHNFQHALDVLQAVYCYLYQAGCIPSIEFLLKQDRQSSLPQFEENGKGKPALPSDALPPSRKLWRKPSSGGNPLMQRALRNQDLFALFVAAIGHDIGHPGLSNTFLKNAKTPLAELFDESVLEKMHCTLLLEVMRAHDMGYLLDRLPSISSHTLPFSSHVQSRNRTDSDPGILTNGVLPEQNGNATGQSDGSVLDTISSDRSSIRPALKKSLSAYPSGAQSLPIGPGTEFRTLLMKTVLVTDMSVHDTWMLELEEAQRRLDQEDDSESEEYDIFNRTGRDIDCSVRLLLCQALIKCADISNPSRPPPACKNWSCSLIAEWAEQAMLEGQLALPKSVSACDDPILAAKGQIGFVTRYTLPLLKATSLLIPEMDIFVQHCYKNLAMWQTKIDKHNAKVAGASADMVDGNGDDSAAEPDFPSEVTASPVLLPLPVSAPDTSTMFALSIPAALLTPSMDYPQPAWPTIGPSFSSPGQPQPQQDQEPVYSRPQINGSSPPTSSVYSSQPETLHRRQTSHTELPQVSIPSGPAVSFPSQPARSSSTPSVSPLFSPRSVTTSTSSPRSELPSPASGFTTVTSMLGLQSRGVLRAAYDAHGRPKSMRRLENRTSWQGSVVLTSSATAISKTTHSHPRADVAVQVPDHDEALQDPFRAVLAPEPNQTAPAPTQEHSESSYS